MQGNDLQSCLLLHGSLSLLDLFNYESCFWTLEHPVCTAKLENDTGVKHTSQFFTYFLSLASKLPVNSLLSSMSLRPNWPAWCSCWSFSVSRAFSDSTSLSEEQEEERYGLSIFSTQISIQLHKPTIINTSILVCSCTCSNNKTQPIYQDDGGYKLWPI